MQVLLMTTIFMGLLLTSCQKNDEGGSKTKPPRDYDQQDEPVECKTAKVVGILSDSKKVISQSAKDPNQYVVWNSDNGNLIHKINRSLNFLKVSESGKYIIRRVSGRRIMLEHISENSTFRESLAFSGKITDLHFTRKDNFLLVSYKGRDFQDLNRIVVFDINRRDIIWGANIENVKSINFVNGESLYLGLSHQGRNSLAIYNVVRDKEEFINLSFGRFKGSFIAKDFIIAYVSNNLTVYNKRNLELAYSKKIKSIYNVNYSKQVALVSQGDWDEVELLDIRRNEVLYSAKIPKEVNITSCKLRSDNTALCFSKVNPNEVVHWNIQKNILTSMCY